MQKQLFSVKQLMWVRESNSINLSQAPIQTSPVAKKCGIIDCHCLKGFICKALHKTGRSIHIPFNDANVVNYLICNIFLPEKPVIFRKSRTYPSFWNTFLEQTQTSSWDFMTPSGSWKIPHSVLKNSCSHSKWWHYKEYLENGLLWTEE